MTSFTVPSPRTWKNDDIPDYAVLQTELFDTMDFLANPPALKFRQTVPMNCTNSAWSTIIWDGIELDTHGAFSSANSTRATPQVPGWYKGYFGVDLDKLGTSADTTGRREVQAYWNMTRSYGRKMAPANAFTASTFFCAQGLSFLAPFNGSTDYIQVRIWQNSGSTLKTLVSRTDYQPVLYMKWHCRL